MKKEIFSFFSSNILINVKGKNINNFINKLIKNNINVYNIDIISYREANIIINYNDLNKINKFKTIYDIKIIKYYGKLAFILSIKKNIYLLIFLMLSIFLLYFFSHIILKVEVIHSNSKVRDFIIQELKYYGIDKYTYYKDDRELILIKKKILDNNKDKIEWIEITRSGTKYIVKLEERIINDKKTDNKIYDIVSSKDSIIKSIIFSSGEKIKKKNDYVKKGDIIISSDIKLPNEEVIRKSANGKVIGEVWYEVDIIEPLTYNEVIYTGNKRKVLSFKIFNKTYSLFNFKHFRTFNHNIKYIYKSNFIPISLFIDNQYETNVINEIYTYDEAKSKAILRAKKRLNTSNSKIISIDKITIVNEEELASKVRLKLFIEVTEDITSYKEKIMSDS